MAGPLVGMVVLQHARIPLLPVGPVIPAQRGCAPLALAHLHSHPWRLSHCPDTAFPGVPSQAWDVSHCTALAASGICCVERCMGCNLFDVCVSHIVWACSARCDMGLTLKTPHCKLCACRWAARMHEPRDRCCSCEGWLWSRQDHNMLEHVCSQVFSKPTRCRPPVGKVIMRAAIEARGGHPAVGERL